MVCSFIYFQNLICDSGDMCDLLLALLDAICFAVIAGTMFGGTKLLYAIEQYEHEIKIYQIYEKALS